MARNPLEIVTDCINEFGNGRESVMQILTRVNDEFGFIPVEVIDAVAEAPVMQVNGTPYGNLTPQKACEIVRN